MGYKILVTGGAGYIGSVFVSKLLDEDYQVTVLDNFMFKQDSLLDVCHHANLNIVVDDVRNEKLLINYDFHLLKYNKFDYFI